MPSQQAGGRSRTAPPQPAAPPGDLTDAPAPEALDEASLALAQSGGDVRERRAAGAQARPVLDPPGTPGASRVGADAGAFLTARILALFSSAHANNGWAYLEGIGWRRLATGTASAHLNLGALLAAARIQGTATPVRHEADNLIHEVYLW